jgi:hypothetical protein
MNRSRFGDPSKRGKKRAETEHLSAMNFVILCFVKAEPWASRAPSSRGDDEASSSYDEGRRRREGDRRMVRTSDGRHPECGLMWGDASARFTRQDSPPVLAHVAGGSSLSIHASLLRPYETQAPTPTLHIRRASKRVAPLTAPDSDWMPHSMAPLGWDHT